MQNDLLTGPGPATYTPTSLNRQARAALENIFGSVKLEGEISNFSRSGAGHCYFTIKDARAQVSCAMFASAARKLKMDLSDGVQVVAAGRISLYEAQGRFQLIVQSVAAAGVGALLAQLEALRKKLKAEGLFDADRKRPLPAFPDRIGVFTARGGAAVKDVISVVGRRYPGLAVRVYPVPVQGVHAAAQIIRALALAEARDDCDAYLITRGGGSLEDLWCFNDEALVRAIADLKKPVVAAIGHEVDTTLAELAADLRAATPSAAAELLSPDGTGLKRQIGKHHTQLRRALANTLQQSAQRLDLTMARLQRASPVLGLEHGTRDWARARVALERTMENNLSRARQRWQHAQRALVTQSPAAQLTRQVDRLIRLRRRLRRAVRSRHQMFAQRQAAALRTLQAVGPQQVLNRGYSVLRTTQGKVVASRQQVESGQRLLAQVSDGTIDLEVLAQQENLFTSDATLDD